MDTFVQYVGAVLFQVSQFVSSFFEKHTNAAIFWLGVLFLLCLLVAWVLEQALTTDYPDERD